MDSGQSLSRSRFFVGRKTILFLLMGYSLLLSIVSFKYLYHYQEPRMKLKNTTETGVPVHNQSIRNIVHMQDTEFMFHGGAGGGSVVTRGGQVMQEGGIIRGREGMILNDTFSNNSSNVNCTSLGTVYNNTDTLNPLNDATIFTSNINNTDGLQLSTRNISGVVANQSMETMVINSRPINKEPPPSRPSVLYRYKSMRTSKPFENHCKKCAIVSSSGQLLGKHLGPEIDSYPCVLRMNTAPVRSFEKDVGRKTTFRVSCFISTKGLLSSPSLFMGEGKPEKVLIWGLYHKKNAWALRNAKSLNAKYRNVEFYAQQDSGEAYAGEIFKKETGLERAKTNTWLSTGWFTMMIALDMCDDIHVYGMIPEDYCLKHPVTRVKYHYFQTSQNPAECTYYKSQEGNAKGGHRLMTEKAIFERWGRRYNMTFHSPIWHLHDQQNDKQIDTPFMKKYAKKQR